MMMTSKKHSIQEARITDTGLTALIDLWTGSDYAHDVSPGPSVDCSMSAAAALRQEIKRGAPLDLDLDRPGEAADILYASIRSLAADCPTSPHSVLVQASVLSDYVSRACWNDELDERNELLRGLAFLAFRAARILGVPRVSHLWEAVFARELFNSVQKDVVAEVCESSNASALTNLMRTEDGVLQALLYLYEQRETAPRLLAEKASVIHGTLVAGRGDVPSDLRDYLLGFSGRIAAIASRALGRFGETLRWLDLAEQYFSRCPDSRLQIARLAYVRLAVSYTLDQFEEVIEASPSLEAEFAKECMWDDLAKCRILWAACLKCQGDTEAALEVLDPLRSLQSVISPSLTGWVLRELGDIHLLEGDYARGFSELTQAIQLLSDSNHVAGWAMAVALMGYGYRSQGRVREAIWFFQKAQAEYAALEMTPLESYIRLLVTEAYTAVADWKAAEKEARAIIPIFKSHGMFTDAQTAAQLLREAMLRQRPDPKVLAHLRRALR
jgi:tetratricopeptide (TPR) repeat protein